VELPFSKLEAAGNAYVAIDGRGLALDLELDPGRGFDFARLAREMARPHFGVGSDGLLVVAEPRQAGAALRMRVFNSDGSESEMSGNGIRLFTRFALDRGLASCEPGGSVVIETGGGLRSVYPELVGGRMVGARVAMGRPTFVPAEIPVDVALVGGATRLVGFALEAAGRSLAVTCLAVGNPHCVWLTERVAELPLDELGPAVEHHPLFPNRVNFEVVEVLDRTHLRARVWERGEGETPSSGTCSTAAVVAARLHGRVDARVTVELPGGELVVAWEGEGDEAWLEGPTREVFSGVWPLAVAGPGRARR
jgi:diaminopimelate epimerase